MGTVYNKNGGSSGSSKMAFGYTASISNTARKPSVGDKTASANGSTSNKITFPKAVNAIVQCTSGSGWSVNGQALSSGVTRTLNNVTYLQFSANANVSAGEDREASKSVSYSVVANISIS